MGKSKIATAEAARRLGVCRQTLIRWRSRGLGPPYTRMPGAVLYDEVDIALWILRRRSEAKGDHVAELPEIEA